MNSQVGYLFLIRQQEAGRTLEIICFMDRRMQNDGILVQVAQKLAESGTVWISTVRIPQTALHACITSYRTDSEDVEALVSAVGCLRTDMLR